MKIALRSTVAFSLLWANTAKADYNSATGLFQSGSNALSASDLNDALLKRCTVNLSNCLVSLPNAATPLTLSTLFGDTYVVPDWFAQSADGADDAPAIRRAQATGLPLRFRCRHYNIKTPSIFTNRLQWIGCGMQLLYSAASNANTSGTWLDIDGGFQTGSGAASANAVPFTIQGTATPGSLITGFGISQVQPYPATSTGAWSPAPYNYVFALANTGGEVSFQHTFWAGISYGVQAINSTRLDVRDMRGQWFNNAITVNEAHDVIRIVDFHNYPYWADNYGVELYQQANLDTIVLGRADTPFIDRFFTIGAKSGIRFSNYGTGTVSGAALGTISCDFVKYCLWADNTAKGVSYQVSMLRSFAQVFNTASTMVPGSSVVQVDGQVYIGQIDSLIDYGSAAGTFAFTNPGDVSTLQVGRVTVQNVNLSDPGSALVVQNSTGSSGVYLSSIPLFFGTKPSGYNYATSTTNGGLFIANFSRATGAAQ